MFHRCPSDGPRLGLPWREDSLSLDALFGFSMTDMLSMEFTTETTFRAQLGVFCTFPLSCSHHQLFLRTLPLVKLTLSPCNPTSQPPAASTLPPISQNLTAPVSPLGPHLS